MDANWSMPSTGAGDADGDTLLTIAEVADILRVSPKTIYNWVYRRMIPSIKIGRGLLRFRREDLRRWIIEQATV